jgi:hypothetical protein
VLTYSIFLAIFCPHIQGSDDYGVHVFCSCKQRYTKCSSSDLMACVYGARGVTTLINTTRTRALVEILNFKLHKGDL